MKIAANQLSKILCVFLLAFVVAMGVAPTPCSSAPGSSMVQVQGLIPQKAIDNAKLIGGLSAETEISLVFALPLRNQQELDDLLNRLYDPNDPL